MDAITINNIFFIICMCTSKKVYPIKGYTFFLFGNPICFSGKEEKHWIGRPHRVAPTDVRFEMWITPDGVEPHLYGIRGTRKKVFPLGIVDSGDHTGSPLRWTHGSSANYKYMSSITGIVGQGSRSVRTCLILLGFRRGDPAWSPVSKCEFHRAV